MNGEWMPYPGRRRVPVHTDLADNDLTAADRTACVVGMGARCELVASGPDALSARLLEYVWLDTGRVIVLRDDRGFSLGTAGRPASEGSWSTDLIIRSVLLAVLPDQADDDAFFDADDNYLGEVHDHDELATRARVRGIDVTGDDLRRLPYDVVLGDDVLVRCAMP